MSKAMLLMLLMLAPALQDGREATKQLLDNNRVTVREITAVAHPSGSQDRDVVAIDLDVPSAVFISRGTAHPSPKHGIIIDLKDASVPLAQNQTQYPMAFPRPGVKKIIDNNRVVVWDYTWTLGKPAPMHFHDKDLVVVYLADGQLKSTTPDGKSETYPISPGLTKFNAANRTHTEEVVRGSARAIIVELK